MDDLSPAHNILILVILIRQHNYFQIFINSIFLKNLLFSFNLIVYRVFFLFLLLFLILSAFSLYLNFYFSKLDLKQRNLNKNLFLINLFIVIKYKKNFIVSNTK